MSREPRLANQVKAFRMARGWSQHELARRAGISRTAVSAIESRRLVPSVAAALALAAALDCRVEDLFGAESRDDRAAWAWPAPGGSGRFWHATIGGRTLLYPAEPSALGVVGHDGVAQFGAISLNHQQRPERTLVMASCDPAASLLANELARQSEFRLLVLPRSSGDALDLLEKGLVHLAGIHLAAQGKRGGNASVVRGRLGKGYSLVRMAKWEAGLAVSPQAGVGSVRSAVRSKLRWVGREAGSGARQCLDELLDGRPPPKRMARDHRGVAEAVRCGWADIGVCLRLTAEEAGLKFLGVRNETYDVCFPTPFSADPRALAFLEVVRSRSFQQLLGELPGYDVSGAGELQVVE